jgi:hypothetical protein
MSAAADVRVLRELWISFVSVVRSYVAAHDMARPTGRTLVDEGLLEDAVGHLTLRNGQKILTLEFSAETGAGSWTVYENNPGPERVLQRGEFRIGTDSLVALSDRRGTLELEVAAEAFTAKIFDEE